MSDLKKPQDCFECMHFYITYEQAFPRGCKAYGFKSKELPIKSLVKASGVGCQQFKAKKKPS